jgi:hypothetical protein
MPVIRELTRWGMRRRPDPDPSHPPRPLLTARAALFAYAQPDQLTSGKRTFQVNVDGQPFTFTIGDGTIGLPDGPPLITPNLTVTVSASDLIRLRRSTGQQGQAGADIIQYQPADQALINEFRTVIALT